MGRKGPNHKAMQPARKKTKYTYHDYLTWDDNERWEIINGEVYNMTPAPTTGHQSIAGICYKQLASQLAGKKCIPFMAPTDVVLSEEDVVQPDVFVVCEKKKITSANIQGAPTLIIEVLSPSTAVKDKREKKVLYKRAGVKEYILVSEQSYAERYYLQKNSYQNPEIFGKNETIILKSLKKTKLALKGIFDSAQRIGK